MESERGQHPEARVIASTGVNVESVNPKPIRLPKNVVTRGMLGVPRELAKKPKMLKILIDLKASFLYSQ